MEMKQLCVPAGRPEQAVDPPTYALWGPPTYGGVPEALYRLVSGRTKTLRGGIQEPEFFSRLTLPAHSPYNHIIVNIIQLTPPLSSPWLTLLSSHCHHGTPVLTPTWTTRSALTSKRSSPSAFTTPCRRKNVGNSIIFIRNIFFMLH